MVDSHNDPLLGTIIDNRYEIRSVIGSGGMGVVYKAFHQNLEKAVAVKVLTDLGDVGSVNIKRFQTEAVALKDLNHNHIVRVYGMGVTETGKPYIALEYLNGGSLNDLLERTKGTSLENAWTLFEQLADALAHAHQQKILHRDIKPGNLMFVETPGDDAACWHVKLVDFGISKLMNTSERQKLTQTGSFIGTPLYMSPEQLGAGLVSEAGDVYSAGCVMYQCLFGRAPFAGHSIMEVAYNQASAEVDIPALSIMGEQIPAALRALLLKTLEKSPEKRIADGTQLAAWIRKTRAQPNTVPEELKQTAGRPRLLVRSAQGRARRKLAISVGVGLISVLGAGSWMWISDHTHQMNQHDATIKIQGELDHVEADIRDGREDSMARAKAALSRILEKDINLPDLRTRVRSAVLSYADRICSRGEGVELAEKSWGVTRAVEATRDAGVPDDYFKMLLLLTRIELELANKSITPAQREAHLYAVTEHSRELREAYKHITRPKPRQWLPFEYGMASIATTGAVYRTLAGSAKDPAESRIFLDKARTCLEPAVELLFASPDLFSPQCATQIAAVYYDVLSSTGDWDGVQKFARKFDKPLYTDKLKDLRYLPKFWIVVANCAQNKSYDESVKLLKPVIAELDKRPTSTLPPEATLYYYYYAAITRSNDSSDSLSRFKRAADIAALHPAGFAMARIDAELGMADVYRCMGNFEEGKEHIATARRLLASYGDKLAAQAKYESAAVVEKRINAKDRAL